jgi:hypothetical protein
MISADALIRLRRPIVQLSRISRFFSSVQRPQPPPAEYLRRTTPSGGGDGLPYQCRRSAPLKGPINCSVPLVLSVSGGGVTDNHNLLLLRVDATSRTLPGERFLTFACKIEWIVPSKIKPGLIHL